MVPKEDLDRALLECFNMAVAAALRAGETVHPQMIGARNQLLLTMPGLQRGSTGNTGNGPEQQTD